MSERDIRSEAVSVVLKGSFNPAIISAGWLLAHHLISQQEHDGVHPEVIVPNLTVFDVATIRFQVTQDTMSIHTENQREFERPRDLAVGILTLLSHTPLNMMGINHFFHVALPSQDSWHRVGDTLAPKEPWSELLELPGTQDVTVQGVRPDTFAGKVVVTVQPSPIIPQGVFVSQNDHYVLREVERQPQQRSDFLDPRIAEGAVVPEPSPDLLPLAKRILTDHWSTSHARAEQVMNVVVSLGEGR